MLQFCFKFEMTTNTFLIKRCGHVCEKDQEDALQLNYPRHVSNK